MSFVYIAGPFFNDKQKDLIKRIENELDKYGIKYFSPRSEGVLIDMTPEEKEKQMSKIYNSNINHMIDCKCMLAIIDDWDTGTVFEMGYAKCLNKPIFTLSDNDYGLNVMIRQAIKSHNTDINNTITNIFQYFYGAKLTNNKEMTKNIT